MKPGFEPGTSTIARPVLHLQFARFLAESAHLSNGSISPPDLQGYAHDALSSFGSSEDLIALWTDTNHHQFGPIRTYYEKLFAKVPGARTELRLPAPHASPTPNESASNSPL